MIHGQNEIQGIPISKSFYPLSCSSENFHNCIFLKIYLLRVGTPLQHTLDVRPLSHVLTLSQHFT